MVKFHYGDRSDRKERENLMFGRIYYAGGYQYGHGTPVIENLLEYWPQSCFQKKKLDSITIEYPDGTPQMKFEFIYEYIWPYNVATPSTLKMILKSVTRVAPNGERLPSTIFSYHPYVPYYGYGSVAPGYLGRITYPTGGYVVYMYERKIHTFMDSRWSGNQPEVIEWRVRQRVTDDGFGNKTYENYEYYDGNWISTQGGTMVMSYVIPGYLNPSITFEPGEILYNKVKVRRPGRGGEDLYFYNDLHDPLGQRFPNLGNGPPGDGWEMDGLMYRREVYDGEGRLVKREDLTHEVIQTADPFTYPAGSSGVAVFRLMIDNNKLNPIYDEGPVVMLDVWVGAKKKQLASKDIYRTEFREPNKYQDFYVSFPLEEKNDQLEFRTYWHGRAWIKQDYVVVSTGSSSKIYEAESAKIGHLTGKLSPDGKSWEAVVSEHGANYLCYGPYESITIAPYARFGVRNVSTIFDTSGAISDTTEYGYRPLAGGGLDPYGNLRWVRKWGDDNTPDTDDDRLNVINYWGKMGEYIVDRKKEVESWGKNQLLAKTQYTYDWQGNLLTEGRLKIETGEVFTTRYTYDRYGNLIQVEDALRRPSATLYDDSYYNTYPIATFENAREWEVTHLNFEAERLRSDWSGSGEIEKGSNVYTGNFSWKIPGKKNHWIVKNIQPGNLDLNKTYVFSAWVKGEAGDSLPYIDISYVNKEGKKYWPAGMHYKGSGDWELLQARVDLSKIEGELDVLILGAGNHDNQNRDRAAYFDDILFYPEGAFPTTYTYDKTSGLKTDVSDPNGRVTRYQYDSLWRLKRVVLLGDTWTSPSIEYTYYTPANQAPWRTEVRTKMDDRYITSRTFIDGLGRKIQGQLVKDSGNVIVNSVVYDNFGRVYRTYEPFLARNTGNLDKGVAAGTPYVERAYENSPLERLRIITYDRVPPQGPWEIPPPIKSPQEPPEEPPIRTTHEEPPSGEIDAVPSPEAMQVEYTYDGLTVTRKDERGNVTKTTSNVYGETVKVEGDPGRINAVTTSEYDQLGRLTKVKHPNGLEDNYFYNSLSQLIRQQTPDSGEEKFRYDPVGNLTYRTNAKNETTRYTYDELNRLTGVYSPTDPWVIYIYDEGVDGRGKLTRMIDGPGETIYTYDARGRLTNECKSTPDLSAVVSYTYDNASNVTSITYPNKRVVKYDYALDGSLDNVKFGSKLLATYEYYPNGAVRQVRFGNGVTTSYGLHPIRPWVQTINTGLSGSPIFQRYYEYYPDGNLYREYKVWWEGVPRNLAGEYQYNALDELTSASVWDTGGKRYTFGYTYDNSGNRQTVTKDGQTYNYSYVPGTNRISFDGEFNYEYDALGRRIATREGGRKQFSYSYYDSGMLKSVDFPDTPLDENYTYDGAMQLVKVKYKGQDSEMRKFYSGGRVIEEEFDGKSTSYVYGNGLVARVDLNGGVSYYHADRLGSIRSMTDDTGKVSWGGDYGPFGENIGSPQEGNKFQFTGEEYNKWTEFYHLRMREYDPQTGGFITPEPLRKGHPYVYTRNNPTNFTDPSGLGDDPKKPTHKEDEDKKDMPDTLERLQASIRFFSAESSEPPDDGDGTRGHGDRKKLLDELNYRIQDLFEEAYMAVQRGDYATALKLYALAAHYLRMMLALGEDTTGEVRKWLKEAEELIKMILEVHPEIQEEDESQCTRIDPSKQQPPVYSALPDAIPHQEEILLLDYEPPLRFAKPLNDAIDKMAKTLTLSNFGVYVILGVVIIWVISPLPP